MAGYPDVTLVTDPRFMGGTAAGFRTDVHALRSAGLTVGLIFHRSGQFFRSDDAENPDLLALADVQGIVIDPRRTRALFLHNPQIFGPARISSGSRALSLPECDRMFMVAHHPPFLGDGALEYDPLATTRAVRGIVADRPLEWLPVSGLVREQLRSFQPLIALGSEDWNNSFETGDWRSERKKLQSADLVVGRHGRAHPDKWPDTSTDIAASLPAGPQTTVRVLGADPRFFAEHGVNVSDWDVLPFGAEPPAKFLDGLDVFSYFHGSRWREAFGRTVAEAMMMDLRCILDPALRPTFGDHALYCRPAEVSDCLEAIRADRTAHRSAARDAGDWCRRTFAVETIGPRFERLMAKRPKRIEAGPRSTSPLVAARKWMGYHLRERQMRTLR